VTMPTKPEPAPKHGTPSDKPEPIRDPQPITPLPPGITDPGPTIPQPIIVAADSEPSAPRNHPLRVTRFQ
jgi:hypothetical protein